MINFIDYHSNQKRIRHLIIQLTIHFIIDLFHLKNAKIRAFHDQILKEKINAHLLPKMPTAKTMVAKVEQNYKKLNNFGVDNVINSEYFDT